MEGEFYDPVYKAALDKDQALHHALHMAENDDVLELFWHHEELVKNLLSSGCVIRHHPSGNADIVAKRFVKVGDVITNDGKLCIVTSVEELEVPALETELQRESRYVQITKTTEWMLGCVVIDEEYMEIVMKLRSIVLEHASKEYDHVNVDG